ncbi:MAG: site-specific integrase [Anaerolineae bacterium]|nr:site-specific integrase [Anaerolineae bacterium]
MLVKIDTIDRAVQAVLITVSDSSKRVYQTTYDKWFDWCHNHKIAPIVLHPANINQFLIDQHVTRRTRQRQLSAMRALLKILALNPNTPEVKLAYDIMKMAKIPVDNLADSERNLKALQPGDVTKILDAWAEDTVVSVRNRALLALLLATGMRRSEVAVMEWRDINLETRTAIVRHGKGDKQREVAIVGEYAVDALRQWQRYQSLDRRFVFPPLDNQGNLLDDHGISGDNVYRIVRQTQNLTGIDFTPHDIRRTLATELLAEGASVADVQEQLGHAHANTTLRYAKAADAQTRRKRFKTRYGN